MSDAFNKGHASPFPAGEHTDASARLSVRLRDLFAEKLDPDARERRDQRARSHLGLASAAQTASEALEQHKSVAALASAAAADLEAHTKVIPADAARAIGNYHEYGVYCRVSTPEQGRGHSMDSQYQEVCGWLAKQCSGLNLDSVKCFGDVASGRSTFGRPGLAAALDWVSLARGRIIVVTEIDRLSRNPIDLSKMMLEERLPVYALEMPDAAPEALVARACRAWEENQTRGRKIKRGMDRACARRKEAGIPEKDWKQQHYHNRAVWNARRAAIGLDTITDEEQARRMREGHAERRRSIQVHLDRYMPIIIRLRKEHHYRLAHIADYLNEAGCTTWQLKPFTYQIVREMLYQHSQSYGYEYHSKPRTPKVTGFKGGEHRTDAKGGGIVQIQ